MISSKYWIKKVGLGSNNRGRVSFYFWPDFLSKYIFKNSAVIYLWQQENVIFVTRILWQIHQKKYRRPKILFGILWSTYSGWKSSGPCQLSNFSIQKLEVSYYQTFNFWLFGIFNLQKTNATIWWIFI